MSLAPGARLGAFEVTGPLGAGGMGEVYQARDTVLNRLVALKILPEAFAGDPDRLARFRREAQVLASLNHHNIAAIYGVEEAADRHALVSSALRGPPSPIGCGMARFRQIRRSRSAGNWLTRSRPRMAAASCIAT